MHIAEKARLEKLLGMLGSSFDGERANAARMISAMAEKQRMTVVELIYGARAQVDQKLQPKPRSEPPNHHPRATAMSDTMLEALAEIAENPDRYELLLTEWEFQFAADVAGRYSRDYELSAKQLAVVEKILRKARFAMAQK
jgi:hypothetical protein